MTLSMFKNRKPLVDLDKLDLLIDVCLTGLIDRTEEAKLPDFVKLVELRHRIDPLQADQNSSMDQINNAREDALPMTSDIPSRGESTL